MTASGVLRYLPTSLGHGHPSCDPEDVEEAARKRLGGGDPALDDAEQRAYESGEDLLESLDAETLESLVVEDASPDA